MTLPTVDSVDVDESGEALCIMVWMAEGELVGFNVPFSDLVGHTLVHDTGASPRDGAD